MDYTVLKKICMIPSRSGYESKLIDYITSTKLKNFKICKLKLSSKMNKSVLISKTYFPFIS